MPIIKSEERFWEDEDKRGDDNEEITELPDNFKQWAAQNKDRIDKAEQRGTSPYFARDNRERMNRAIKQGRVRSGGDYILDPSGTPSSGGGDIVGRFLDIPITKKEAISRLRELATNYDHEEAYVFLPDGRVYHKVGVLNKVTFTTDECKLFEGGVLMHNHRSETLSFQDVYFAISSRLNEIRAICPNKQFSIIIPNGLSVSVSDFKEITKMAYEKLESKAKKLDSQKIRNATCRYSTL